MDVIGQWIAERCDILPTASIATNEAYDDYARWASGEVGWQLKKLTFRRHLSDRGFTALKGAQGRRLIAGLRLKPYVAPTVSTVIGALEDGRIIRDDGISVAPPNEKPATDGKSPRWQPQWRHVPPLTCGGAGGGRRAILQNSSMNFI